MGGGQVARAFALEADAFHHSATGASCRRGADGRVFRAGRQGTALASVIGFVELTKAGSVIVNATFDAFRVYGFVVLFYFALCYPLSLGAKALERRMTLKGH